MQVNQYILQEAERMPRSAGMLNIVSTIAKVLAAICGVFCFYLAIVASNDEDTAGLIAAIIYGIFSVAGCIFFSAIMEAFRDLVWNTNRTAEYNKIMLLRDMPEPNQFASTPNPAFFAQPQNIPNRTMAQQGFTPVQQGFNQAQQGFNPAQQGVNPTQQMAAKPKPQPKAQDIEPAVQYKFGDLYPIYVSEAKMAGVSINELFAENENTWHCTCGQTNSSDYIKCRRCGADIEVLRTISSKKYLEQIKNRE